jgi:hypothetical protein
MIHEEDFTQRREGAKKNSRSLAGLFAIFAPLREYF